MQHRTVLIIFPLILQTIIIAQIFVSLREWVRQYREASDEVINSSKVISSLPESMQC